MTVLLLLLVAACTPEVTGGDSAGPEEEQDDTPDPCEVVELDVIGNENPVVGDSWTVWLRSDGATLTGATVLRFDPPDFATVEVNVATFLYAGSATLIMQVGAYREEMEVSVTE